MPLGIPPDEIPGIVKLYNLADDVIEGLIRALSSSKAVPDHEQMAAQIADRIEGIPKKDLTIILDTLYSLYHVREMSEVRPERFLNDLIEGISNTGREELGAVKGAEVHRLRGRFKKLLSIDTLNTVSRALALQRTGERLFSEAKILSDIRPVFGDNVTEQPVAAVITHTLKLTYHEDGEDKTFFVIFDSEDLERLRTIVERARTKDKTLRLLLKDANVSELGL